MCEIEFDSKTKIASMRVEHLSQVCKIEKDSFSAPWSEYSFLLEIKENAMASYKVAIQDGLLIGYYGLWFMVDEVHITTLAVHPYFRGQGLAITLLKQIIIETKEKGYQDITLEVRTSNQIAIKLYEKFGFKIRGVRKKYYKDEDAYIMWKNKLNGDNHD